jgi:hypothetical protein
MEYILIQFTLGWDFQAYQEISNGNLVRITDLDGNTLTYPDFPVESYVVDANPPKPSWAE